MSEANRTETPENVKMAVRAEELGARSGKAGLRVFGQCGLDFVVEKV